MKLSIVITTRNRPEAVFYNLSSLMQNESDFEVIVSDNGTSRLCKDAFDKATNGDKRFTYVRPDRPLDIYDHFEFALQFAKGDYITFLEDKKIFFAGAIDFVSEICNKYNPEIVSYDICFYTPSNESFDKGSYKSFQVMDGKDEIEEYESENEFRRMLEYRDYLRNIIRGNLLWGFYKKRIFDDSMRVMGGYFKKFYSFDSGPKFIAMFLAKNGKCFHIKRPILIDCIMKGRGVKTHNYNFLKETYTREVPCIEMKETMIPGVDKLINSWYFIGQEYLWILSRLQEAGYDCSDYELNIPGMLAKIYYSVYDNPLDEIPESVLNNQKAIIQKSIKALNENEKNEFWNIYKKYWNCNYDYNPNRIIHYWNEITLKYPVVLDLYNRTIIGKLRNKKKENVKSEKQSEAVSESSIQCSLSDLISKNAVFIK